MFCEAHERLPHSQPVPQTGTEDAAALYHHRALDWLQICALIDHRSPHVLHMQKALLQMNIQLSQAVSDVTGVTGQAIIRAILSGVRDPQMLASLREPGCKKSEEEIAKALTGTWREEHLFVLKQAVALYDFYAQQISECDEEIERKYSETRADWESGELPPLPARKRNSHSKNRLDFSDGKANLAKYADTHIRRHVKVRSAKSPYDGDWPYWINRLGKDPSKSNRVIALLKNQLGRCLYCGLHFMADDHLETHHRNGNHNDNAIINLVLLHGHCHDEVHRTKSTHDKEPVI